jgi:2-methylisocitrate lyase-like PEP mutase family enzyme
MSTRQKLRSLMAGEPFMAAECYSALSARIVEEVGFPAAYMGGRGTSMMHFAIPDNGVFTPTEMIEQAGRVAEAISIPLIIDADQCGETVADVYRSIQRYEHVGVAGVHIEDEVPPKHSKWDGPLLSIPDMQARIRAAVSARRDPDFVIIVRCDELYAVGGGGSGSLDEAVRRAVAYDEAGADAYLPTFATEDQVAAIKAAVKLPIVGFGSFMPGLEIVLSTGWGTASAARVHRQWATHLLEHGDLPSEAYEFPGKAEAIQQDPYDALIEGWVTSTGRVVRPPAT